MKRKLLEKINAASLIKIILLAVFLLAFNNETYGQATIRYQNNVRGGFTVATNSLRQRTAAPLYANTDGGTNASSYSDLVLPPGSTVVKAILYVEEYVSAAGMRLTGVKFKVPGGAYVNLNTASPGFIANPITSSYSQFIIDVTSLIPTNGFVSTLTAGGNAATTGRYSVADPVPFDNSTSNYGSGWALYVVYTNPTAKFRNVTIADRCGALPIGTPVTFTVNNISVPSCGTVGAVVTMTGSWGDPGALYRDDVKFGRTPGTLTALADPTTGATNDALDSTIGFCAQNNVSADGGPAMSGTYVGRNPYNTFTGVPGRINSTYYDCDIFNANGILAPSPTPINVGFQQTSSGSDALGTGAYAISVDVIPASISGGTLSTNTIYPGCTATYTFLITNTDPCAVPLTNIGFTDNLPSGIIIANPTGATVTGGTGGVITATPGGTSFSLSGLNLAIGQTATVTIDITNAPGQTNPSCATNPAAFTNGFPNISNVTGNAAFSAPSQCLVVAAPPVAVPANRCGTGTVDLSITGCSGTVNWYTAATGGTSISTANPFTTPSISTTTTYYATCTVGTCESPRVPVTATINPGPNAGTSGFVDICASSTTVIDLFSLITGESVGGIWTRTSGTGGIFNGAAGTFDPSGATSSTFLYTITGVAPCADATSTATVNIISLPTATFTDPTDQCLTGNSFTFTNTGSTGAGYTHSWTFGGAITNTSTAVSPSGVSYAAAGTYTVTHTVTSVSGSCTATSSTTVVVFDSPTAIATTIVNASCGASTGSVTLGAVTGGTSGYTYSFNGGGFGPTLSYTGLAPGTYPIVVQDANGCTFTTSATIIDLPGPTAIATTVVDATCGNPTGSVTLGAVTGGTAGYTYNFNNLGYSGTTSYTGLAAATYPLLVKDANGCIYTTSVTVNDIPGPTNIATTLVDAVCGSPNGSVTLGAVTGGTPAYTYNFNNLGFSATTSYTNLAAASYTLEVKDANGCIYTTTVPISNSGGPTNIAYTVVNATCGLSNGSVTLGAVTGGTGPYQYNFNNLGFSGTTSYTALAAGVYPLEVKGANGCLYSTTVTITDAPGVTAVASTIVDATCGLSNGSITLGTVTGGTPTYQFELNTGGYGTTTVFNGLAAGAYTINVKDANGCIFTTSVTINDLPGPTAIASVIVDETCGNANGSVTFGAVTGGTGPYTHNFNNTGYPGVATYSGLAAGSYLVEVKDANGCTFTTTIVIANSPGITNIAYTVVDATCGTPNGTVTLGAVTGGTAPYQYNFNNTGYPGSTSYTGIAAGSYPLEVKDANGCLYNTTVTIINTNGPTAIAYTVTDETCGTANGTVTLGAVTGGTAAYTYNFNNLGYSAVTTYTGLAAGSYVLLVKDANGCVYTTSVTIINSGGPTSIATVLVNETCNSSNGSVTIGGTTGGTAPYTYNFNNTGYPGSTSYTGLAAGTYPLEVKDANGCTFLTSVTLVNLPAVTAIASTTVNETCGSANGTVTLGTVTGGTAPYTYDFNNLGHSGVTTYTGLAAGTYPLEVKDANGCLYNTTITITNVPGPTAIAFTVTNASCGASDGSVTLGAVTGGTAAYTYNFNNLGFSAVTTYTGLAAGSYPLEVKDANGCLFVTVVPVSNAGGPTAVATTQTNATCSNPNGAINIGAVTGGTAPYTYQFNNTGGYTGTTSYTGLSAGVYGIDVKDANGCIFSTTVTITNAAGPTAIAVTIVDSTCGAANGSVTLGAVTGGTAPYQYDFNGSGYSGTTSYTGVSAGTYTLNVRDANNCIYTTSVTLTTTPVPTVTINYPNSPFCVSTVVGQSVTINGTGTYTGGTYSASPGGLSINPTTGDITPSTSTPGTYTVTYTIAPTGGCPTITATTSVTINPELAPTITCGPPTTTSVQFNWGAVTGATGYDVSYTVTGNPAVNAGSVGNVTTYDVTGLTPGSVVTITVTPTNPSGGCFKSASFACTASSCTPATANISYATPFCSNNATPQSVTLTGTGTYTGGGYTGTAGLAINATTGAITPGSSTAGSHTITYLLTGTGGCPDVTATTTIMITPLPTAAISYASTSYCTSNTFPQGVSLTGTGAYTGGTYSAAPAGLSINASTGAVTPGSSAAGNYTITYTTPASGGCAAVTTTTMVTITQLPTATISYATPFCISTGTPQSVTITGTAAYTGGTYSAPGGLTIDVNTGAITPNTSIAGTYIVTYTIPASAGCSTTTATTSVTINGLPVAVATPATQAICSGNTTSIAISSATAGTTFAWTVVQSGGAAGASNGTGNNIAQTLTTGTTAGTVVYTITPTANGCAGAPIDVTITVNASPTATATPAVSAICSGQSTGITLTSTLPGTTYSWTASQSGATGASDGTGNVISQVLTAGTGIGTVIYTITPTANGCVGMPITATVTVTPPPTATATPDVQSVCSNGTTNIALTSNVPGTVFTWNVVQTNVTGASPGTGNVIAQTLIATSIGEAVYVITPTTNGCPGTPITVRITVYPNPTVTANPTVDVICSGETTAISLSSNVPGTTFSWTVDQDNLTGTSSGTGNLIAQTLNTVISADGTATYTITPIANGCPGNSIDVTVTVRPRPEVFGTPNTTICSGESSNITLAPSPGATTTTFAWTVSQVGVTGAVAGTGSFIDQILETTGTTTGTVVYTVTPTANGCEGTPIDLTITVNPLPVPVLEDGIICVDPVTGNSFLDYTLDTGLSNAGYDFVWYFNNDMTTPIPGASSATYDATAEGVYTVVVTNTTTSCVSEPVSATVIPSYPGTIQTLVASPAFTNNASITVTMNPPVNPNYLYSLDDGPLQESNVFSGVNPGEHTIHVTDLNGCTDSTGIVSVIGYPHYFTPNGDGLNDTWNIIGLTDARIYIFDRYGKLIKQISPNGDGWDGTYNGELLPSTDYWFTVDYIELGQGKIFNSHFSLKR